jgi:hypothetical protein
MTLKAVVIFSSPLTDMFTATFVLLAYVALFVGVVVCAVICVLKGKSWMAVAGCALAVPTFGAGVLVLAIGAVRVAKPGSRWALRRYVNDPFKRKLAEVRFPKEALRQSMVAEASN